MPHGVHRGDDQPIQRRRRRGGKSGGGGGGPLGFQLGPGITFVFSKIAIEYLVNSLRYVGAYSELIYSERVPGHKFKTDFNLFGCNESNFTSYLLRAFRTQSPSRAVNRNRRCHLLVCRCVFHLGINKGVFTKKRRTKTTKRVLFGLCNNPQAIHWVCVLNIPREGIRPVGILSR